MLIVLNYRLDLIAVNFNWPTWQGSTVRWEISSTKLRKPLWTGLISYSTFSTHCTNLFLWFSCVFTFLEIIKHNMPKILFSFIFNIKMATQKFINFDFFFKCTLTWQLSQYNLTKLFWMKLKTTTREILWRKTNELFGQPDACRNCSQCFKCINSEPWEINYPYFKDEETEALSQDYIQLSSQVESNPDNLHLESCFEWILCGLFKRKKTQNANKSTRIKWVKASRLNKLANFYN